jgi:gliding motility-associated-like protein
LNPNAVINYECVNNSPKNTVTVSLDASITDFSLVQFALDGGAYQASNEFTDVASGNHIVSVKHNNGCTKVTSGFNIINVDPLTLSLNDGEMNEIIAVAVGGSGNYQFTFDGEFNDSNPSYNYYKTQPYMVMVQDSNGCKTSVTKEFNYVDICVPNYFTPNGDGINDTWSPGCTVNYKNLSFTVFDRFGRELQIGKFGSSWDGKYKGSELPTGDYWYILKLNNPKDDREFVGHFTLYR